MQKNVGRLDAWIRGGLGVIFFTIAVFLNHFPVISLAAALIALVLVGTALTGVCPLYRAMRLDSRTPKMPRV